MATPAGPDSGTTTTVSSVSVLDAPPQNTDVTVVVNPLDNLQTELPPTNVGTLAEIQAMLEAPTGVHLVDDGAGSATVLETQPVVQPGVETAWQEPKVLQEEAGRVVLQPTTGVQVVGEQP